MPVAIVAFVFSMGTIFGAGPTAGMWSLILLMLATPIWVFLRRARPAQPAQPDPE
jgi:basic amino acid/polyamine antiporter, APA family